MAYELKEIIETLPVFTLQEWKRKNGNPLFICLPPGSFYVCLGEKEPIRGVILLELLTSHGVVYCYPDWI